MGAGEVDEKEALATQVNRKHREYKWWGRTWTLVYFVGAFGAGITTAGVTVQAADVTAISSYIDGIAKGAPLTAGFTFLTTVLIVLSVVFNAEQKRRVNRSARSSIEELKTYMTDPDMPPEKIREKLIKIQRKHNEEVSA